MQLQEYDTYSKCVEALSTAAVDAVTTDNVILAGFAAQPQYQGKLKVVGKPFSTETLRRRPEEGRHRVCATKSTPPWRRWSPTARGRRRSKPDRRPVGLQVRHQHQPAEAGRLLIGSRRLRM